MSISTVIGGFAKVPTVGLRPVMPGGFVKRADGGPAVVLPGGFIQLSAGETDPLAALAFQARLQNRVAGSLTPLGMYQDTACTIPATAEFDPVAAFQDELSGSGRKFIQADTDKQPALRFLGGVPVLEFDGIDDCLVLDGANLSPVWLAARVQYIAGGGVARVTSTAGGGNGGFLASFGNWNARYTGSNILLGAATAGYDALFIQGGAGTSRVGFNGSNTPQPDDAIQVGAYSIGDYQSGGGQVLAMYLVALYFGDAAIDEAAQTVVENYTETLSP